MASGTISIAVRPLRFAFLVDPRDGPGLREAITINSLLWGGADNPIISVVRRSPKSWTNKGYRISRSDSWVERLVEDFDPDFLVAVGKCADRKFSIGHRDQISCSDLLGDFPKEWVPRYGVGTIDLLNHVVREELRFERREPLKLAIPKLSRSHSLFLAAVFGDLPPDFSALLRQEYSAFIEQNIQCSIDNYAEFLDPCWLFPRRLTTIELKFRTRRKNFIFLCDAAKANDVIEYWNLRAAGHIVIPLPRQAFDNQHAREMVRKYVDESFGVHRHNSDIHFHALFQLSESMVEVEAKAFIDSLGLQCDEKTGKQKYAISGWTPTFWSSIRSRSSFMERESSYSEQHDVPIQSEQDRLELRTFGPKFEISGYTGKPRFANDFSFRFYGAKELVAEVIPAASREMSNALGRTGYHHWRFSSTGPVFLCHSPRDLIFMDIPRAEVVVTEWLKERGWKTELSVPGKLAKQIAQRLGGRWGLSLLAHECLLQLLVDMTKSDRGRSRTKIIGYFKDGLTEEWGDPNPEGFLERICELEILRLGAEVQCSVCGRYNWYELDKLSYSLSCHYCLSEFKPPLDSPNKGIEWTYRPHGLFAIGDYAQGAYSVLLTLRALGGDHDAGISPLFSYEAKAGENCFESDLTVLYQSSTWNSSEILSVHAECKSYNTFEPKDIRRMTQLSSFIPGSVLVFSTFRNDLTTDEVKLLSALVRKEWRKRLGRHAYSPVIVLTGTELYSLRGLPYCWEGKGGKYDQFAKSHFDRHDLRALADTTQQLYLGLGSFYEWAELRKKSGARRTHAGRGKSQTQDAGEIK